MQGWGWRKAGGWGITEVGVVGYNRGGGVRWGAGILRSVVMLAAVGDVAPDFKLPSPEHGEIALSQYRGEKVVVLSFHVFDFTAG